MNIVAREAVRVMLQMKKRMHHFVLPLHNTVQPRMLQEMDLFVSQYVICRRVITKGVCEANTYLRNKREHVHTYAHSLSVIVLPQENVISPWNRARVSDHVARNECCSKTVKMVIPVYGILTTWLAALGKRCVWYKLSLARVADSMEKCNRKRSWHADDPIGHFLRAKKSFGSKFSKLSG